MGVGPLSPAIFLDRDGVLNDVRVENGVTRPPAGPETVVLLPGVVDACALLRDRGYLLVVVTNQPDVARGSQRKEVVDEINALVSARLAVHAVYTCFHDDADACSCRKPKPGMLLQAAADLGIDPRRSYMVGDRWSDIAAGAAAGCRTIFVDRGTGGIERCQPDWIVPDLSAAAQVILEKEST